MSLRNVTLELSFKPFWNPKPEICEQVCRKMFRQWWPLIKDADSASVQLWVGDGSEILQYSGNLDDEFDWDKYIGCANEKPKEDVLKLDPTRAEMHTAPRLFRDDLPCDKFNYRFLKSLIATIKRTGMEELGKNVSVGCTFDPGPEFAVSDFKYKQHPESCQGSFGKIKDIISCCSVLDKDSCCYAGFPDGIPPNTPFGLFFGRQTRHFMHDFGLDFIWLSNGFGFGNYPWSYHGVLFMDKTFHPEKADQVAEQMIQFWQLFRGETRDCKVMVRGTNLSAGLDLATDGVPLKQIYANKYIDYPPINSPWAPINRDLGIELAGWMSHVAPWEHGDFQFRFYCNDPWWLSSPWLDRYEREPYDIFLPMAVSRIKPDGRVDAATRINIITVDNYRGELADQIPNELIPYFREALAHAPDEPGPLVWLYPFDEYHQWIRPEQGRIDEVLFGDLFIRNSINRGLPLNTVITTGNFLAGRKSQKSFLSANILVTPPPEPDSHLESELLDFVEEGGRVIIYGSLRNAGKKTLSILGISLDRPIEGDIALQSGKRGITLEDFGVSLIKHDPVFSGGGIEEANGKHPLLTVSQSGINRIYAAEACHGKGKIVWLRGSVACADSRTKDWSDSFHKSGLKSEAEMFSPERIFPALLDRFNWRLSWRRGNWEAREPVIAISRHNNAFYFTGMNHNETVEHELRMPFGAPVLTGSAAKLKDGSAYYHFARFWHKECRIFVKQDAEGVVSCREDNPQIHGVTRWINMSFLKDAELNILPEPALAGKVKVVLKPELPYVHCKNVPLLKVEVDGYNFLRSAKNVSGNILIYW